MPRDIFPSDRDPSDKSPVSDKAQDMDQHSSQDQTERTNFQVVGSNLEDLESHPPSHSPLSASFDDAAVKPYVQSLNTLDLESCIKLEEAVLPPDQRLSREELEYWFTTCGELSLGVFTSADTTESQPSAESHGQPQASTAETASTAVPVYSGTPARKSVLLGHIIATKIDGDRISPDDRSVRKGDTTDKSGGHREFGRTIAIQSFAVLPAFQNRGLGTMLLRSYIQRVEGSGLADRIAIAAADSKADYLKWFGFESLGASKVEHAGKEQCVDLVLEVSKSDSD